MQVNIEGALDPLDLKNVKSMFKKALILHSICMVLLFLTLVIIIPLLGQITTCELSRNWFSQLWHLNASYASKLHDLTTEAELCRFIVSNSAASAIGLALVAGRIFLVRHLSSKKYFREGAIIKLLSLLVVISFTYYSFNVNIHSSGRFYPSFITSSGKLNIAVSICIYILNAALAEIFSFIFIAARSHFPWSR